MSKKKILWISDIDKTGYANVSIPLINDLLEDNIYEIYLLPINLYKKEAEVIELTKKVLPKIKSTIYFL